MKILYATSEAFPFAKSGGLGDVAGALPKTLKKNNVDIRAVMPLYQDIPDEYKRKMTKIGDFSVQLNWRHQQCELFYLKHDNVFWYFIKNDYYFGRPGLYGYFDEAERFLFFSKAILSFIPKYDFCPNIIHCNDWQTAAIPMLLKKQVQAGCGHHVRTVLTIHNIKYQGVYGAETLYEVLGLYPADITSELEFNGAINIMKAGIYYADYVTTVSPTYAKELEHAYFGEGLDGVIRDVKWKMTGILNGVDYDIFNPMTDQALPFPYQDVAGKKKNKAAFLKEQGLNPDKLTIGMVSRLVELKGIDLVQRMIEELMALDIQLIVLGTGDYHYEEFFKYVQHRYPTQTSIHITFSNALASNIYAASDLFLMPSRVEPCGLSQIIALKYGALPVVNRTGGLNDTITHIDEGSDEGNGFIFNEYNAHQMFEQIKRAKRIYDEEPERFNGFVKQAFAANFDWEQQSKEYYRVYEIVDGSDEHEGRLI
ncbi:glycogen synthase [Halolactibacillus miurensis]|uniref:Glycogen synthase n=1 Tax=Halolactibacillus miurensis TaxID=306541 RepID=A0A1I6V7V5_9BACI|nr:MULTISPECIES: glycogen/starch synthase [Halolactibacillus]GEM05901.1 glycogen synthase [Halolactibacillus miurensis]SFT09781.1 starch synthase [Halolactibacillus miurensis]